MEQKLSLLDMLPAISLEQRIRDLEMRQDICDKKYDNLRRGLFSRYGEQVKKTMEILYEFETFKKEICEYKEYKKQRDQRVSEEKIVQFNFSQTS